MKNYQAEEQEFLKTHTYTEDVIDGHHLRYVVAGSEDKKGIVFLNGLEILIPNILSRIEKDHGLWE